MDEKCQVLVDDDTVRRLIKDTDQAVKRKYDYFLATSFISSNKNMTSCPNPESCDFIIKVKDPVCQSIICKCGQYFCFKCKEDWHEPIDCECLKLWNKKASDDSETLNWISSHAKLCPKCESPIEKNGGCNHMSCRKCKAEFCWACMTLWASHNHSMACTRYVEDEKTKLSKSTAQQSLKRYMFYFERFINHQRSLKAEKELQEAVQEKINFLQICSKLSVQEVQFLSDALQALLKCRTTLMYTYIFSYYLTEDDSNTCIFVDNQTDLQNRVEDLSSFLEREMIDIQVSDVKAVRLDVINKVDYCLNRRSVLIEHIKEGYANLSWSFMTGAPASPKTSKKRTKVTKKQ